MNLFGSSSTVSRAILVSLITSGFSAMNFRPVKFQNGTLVCAGNTPSFTLSFHKIDNVFPGISAMGRHSPYAVQCGFYCTSTKTSDGSDGCIGFNYQPQFERCDFYSNVPKIWTSWLPCIYHEDVSVVHNASCKQLLARDPSAKSKEYRLRTNMGRTLDKVFCDMTTNGGGYTFINPVDLAVMTEEELLAMYTERQSVVLQVNMTNGTQRYGVLQQLPAFAGYSLKLGLNENNEFTTPLNAGSLGNSFLFIGFIPAAVANVKRMIEGLIVNGQQLTFQNCDGNPKSYLALFPNVSGSPRSYYVGGSIYTQILNATQLSVVNLPFNYFMFFEIGFGGCGSFAQAGGGQSIGGAIGAAIGFR